MQLQTASVSDAGGRSRNEDAHGEWRAQALFACVVADGAGGHGAGDIASRIVVDTVQAELGRVATAGMALNAANLMRILLRANDAIIDAQEAGSERENMRSTAALFAIDEQAQSATWAHCGDTRVYCFRNGVTRIQTQDHSLVQSMLDANLLAKEDARHHPRRNVLFSALGTADDLSIAVSGEPFPLAEGDAFLLCTDGFWEYVEETEMIEAIGSSITAGAWLDALAARVRANAPKGHDNFTATAVWIGEPQQSTILKLR
ncbi:PP2C family serine/threonine-protein phosphatase [Paraburkholderia sp. DHOC27]|uniref:PP2C family protein-serine/threonine phosphatase n=1 Tax=Paraburkholderia sp. DHOC27 TaxID=2303330 RepID=UPI000E3E1845|nr:PP2C family serine/threonine-protein phosphatase [Paraburkholderia sp. DHOC27]RFU48322.1 serine/threonine-protein phosphatase [Paraburkholderia sp. DHOC27]